MNTQEIAMLERDIMDKTKKIKSLEDTVASLRALNEEVYKEYTKALKENKWLSDENHKLEKINDDLYDTIEEMQSSIWGKMFKATLQH